MKFQMVIIGVLILGFYSCEDCIKINPEPCGGSASQPLVDLIVIMDQSGSMNNEAQAVSAAADMAIEVSRTTCNTDLRVKFFGVHAVSFPSTVFTESHIDYLYSLHGTSIQLAANMAPIGQINEQGADAVNDLSQYFDWREKACRSIFYISDEPLDGNTSIDIENAAVDSAIVSANANEVVVFTNAINEGALDQIHIDNYERLCNSTMGENFLRMNVSTETYLELMPQIICNSCNACALNDFLN
jgi:hypothetical protein